MKRHIPAKGTIATGTKLAVFTLICLLLLAWLAVKIGNLHFFTNDVSYKAQLQDVTGLTVNDPVKIAGVTVGQVTNISVVRDYAQVTFEINKNITLKTTTGAGLQWHNVLGQQYFYLYPGTSGQTLQPGGIIPLSQSVSSANFGQFLNALSPFLSAINPSEANAFVQGVLTALQGNTSELNQLISSTASLSQTLGSEDGQVGTLILNLNQVLTALASRSSDLSSVINNFQTTASALANKNQLLDAVVGNLSAVESDLAGLLNTNQGNLSGAISNLSTVSATVQANETQLSNGLQTLGKGLAPYTLISSYGQWFGIQTVYTCLAGQLNCSYYQPTNANPSNSPSASVGSILQMVSGSGS